jgi:DNA-binding winged helix-turn-helix (wHTH) protein
MAVVVIGGPFVVGHRSCPLSPRSRRALAVHLLAACGDVSPDGPQLRRALMVLFVYLLSGLRVVCDGRERLVTSRRQRAVVAALALTPGRWVTTEQLIDAVWGEHPPDGAQATLQTYVSRLRRLLGEGAIVFGPGGYRLGDRAASDAEEAGRHARRARTCLAEDPEAAVAASHAGIDLWQGKAPADVADEAYFAPAAAGLQERASSPAPGWSRPNGGRSSVRSPAGPGQVRRPRLPGTDPTRRLPDLPAAPCCHAPVGSSGASMTWRSSGTWSVRTGS